MLRLRIVTAIVLVAMMIAAALYLPTVTFGALAGVFVLIAAWEWTALAGVTSPAARWTYLGLIAVTGSVVWSLLRTHPDMVSALMGLVAAWWIWALVDLIRHADMHAGLFATTARKLVAGAIVLLPAWLALVIVHDRAVGGPVMAIYLMALVWAADTGAYFAGRAFGRHKVAPAISPGKSWEGVAGGLVVVAVMSAVVALTWQQPNALNELNSRDAGLWIAIAVVAALFSVLGDLTESRLKRAAGVKDSGRIFPGHGGVLDRIDAYTAAAPVFLLGWTWLKPA